MRGISSVHPYARLDRLASVASLAACGAGEGVARVTVTADTEIDGLRTLRATAMGSSGSNDFPLNAPTTISASKPQVFGLRFSADRTGVDVTVAVVALDGSGNPIATGSGNGRVEASKTVEIRVLLHRVGVADMVMNAGDMARDIATSTMPDLAMAEISVPDLAMAEMSVPDLALPDLAMADLRVPDAVAPDLGAVICRFDDNPRSLFTDKCVFAP